MAMNWSRLIKIPCWTPVLELGFDVRLVRETLYQIEENCYLIAVPHNERLELSAETNFATCLLWAEGNGAALRAALKEIENDHVVTRATPPLKVKGS